MSQTTQFLGIDLHKREAVIAILPEDSGSCEGVIRVPNEHAPLRRAIAQIAKRGPIISCYEASGSGYVLHRLMQSWGHQCVVIAPSLAPKRPGDRVKTDRRDAERLAFDLRAGLLTAIHIPTEEEESVRNLVRCREQFRREIHRSKQMILKLLDRHGLKYGLKRNWTAAFWMWLRGIELEHHDQFVLNNHIALLQIKFSQFSEIENRIERVAESDRYREAVGRLTCFRGVKTLTAMTFLVEVIDVKRFSSPRALMDYLGLSVSEYSSGPRRRRGGITKAGNSTVRRILVQAAWQYRHRPAVGVGLKRRQAGQDPLVVAHAWRAQHRLNRRFHRLHARMPSQKAVTAVARELVGFMWAVLQDNTSYCHKRTA